MEGRSADDPWLIEHLRAVFSALPVGVCSRDRERRIVYLNPFAEEVTGYRERDLRGAFCHSAFRHGAAGHTLCAENCAAEAALAQGTTAGPVTLSLRTAGGGQLTVVSRFVPLHDSSGNHIGFSEAFTPATDRSASDGEEVEFDLERRVVRRGGRPLKLTRTEFELLACLARQSGKPVRHAELLRQVWGPECEGQTQYLHTFISQLRHKMEADPRRPAYLVTEPHYGYRLQLQSDATEGGHAAPGSR